MTHVRLDVDFGALARLVTDGLAHVRSDGTVAGWSDAAAAVTGISAESAMGRDVRELFACVDPPLSFAAVPQALSFFSNDEHRRALHATAFSLDDGWLVSFGRAQTFAAIEQFKSEIVTAVSHELKTPIATIKAYATTLRENAQGTAAHRDEYLATIEEQADRLTRRVDELLLAGRVHAEHLVTQRERVRVDELLDDAVQRLGTLAESRVQRRVNGTDAVGDPPLLAQALAHLLENALKFSPPTERVTVEASVEEPRATTIRVIDRGSGIAAEHLPYIFERFYRAERRLTASTPGSGLGLYVARAIAQAHGGSLDVERTGGNGTVMRLRIPVRP
jgi:signal transduction histidine kinase